MLLKSSRTGLYLCHLHTAFSSKYRAIFAKYSATMSLILHSTVSLAYCGKLDILTFLE